MKKVSKRKLEMAARAAEVAVAETSSAVTPFVSRFIAQPGLALGDRAVAATVERLSPFIAKLEYQEECIKEAIGVTVGERHIKSGSDLLRLNLGWPALGLILFEATRGCSLDLISAAQALVLAVRDLLASERAGDLASFVPNPARRVAIEDEIEDVEETDDRSARAKRSWERIRMAPASFGITRNRYGL